MLLDYGVDTCGIISWDAVLIMLQSVSLHSVQTLSLSVCHHFIGWKSWLGSV
jgi:hypothetical protein